MDAAERLFVTRGWASTGMRDVAQEAGVAIETVYKHFDSKRALLQAVMDIAVVGDEAAVPLADRPEFAALGRGPRRDRIAAAAAVARGVHERTAAFGMVLREAAPSDPQMAEVLRATRQRQRADVAAGVTLIIGRPPTEQETDELWALLSPELYLLTVHEAGWSPAAYERWIATLLDRAVPARASKEDR